MRDSEEHRLSIRRLMPGLTVLILLLGLVFIIMDWGRIQSALQQASLRPIPYALLMTAISYLCISLAFAAVARLMGISMRIRDLTLVGFASTVLNHIVSSGGTAGYSVRYALMNRYGVSVREVLAVSFLHFYLTSLVMIAMLPVGLLFLGRHATLGGRTAGLLSALAALVILTEVIATAAIFWNRMRIGAIRSLGKAAGTLLRRDVRPAFARFEGTMGQGVAAMRRHPAAVLGIILLIAVDWSTSATALWYCFRAMEVIMSPGELITGFVIGTVAGVASMIPGGLGVQEGSMAGILALLGISFHRAVLASILFRLVYFIFPYLISLGFYWWILGRKRDVTEMAMREEDDAHSDA
jgi:uncharacterized protein (TIRG00374 family)